MYLYVQYNYVHACISKHEMVLYAYYMMQYNANYSNYIFLAFDPPAPSSKIIPLGSDLILYCPIILYSPSSTWNSNGSQIVVTNSTEMENSSSYDIVFNQTTGAFSDLIITNAWLELDNALFSCGNIGTNIIYSVEITVQGNICISLCNLLW